MAPPAFPFVLVVIDEGGGVRIEPGQIPAVGDALPELVLRPVVAGEVLDVVGQAALFQPFERLAEDRRRGDRDPPDTNPNPRLLSSLRSS